MHSDSQNTNGHVYPGFHPEEEAISLTDELDHEILMHREAHFGGDFQVMLNYYEEDGIGVCPDFEIERIEYLAQIESERGLDLAPLILTGPEAERVSRARIAYTQFKEIYAKENENSNAYLIANLILSEEEFPENEVRAIVEKGEEIVPSLLRVLAADDYYDPLFPGYGYAPFLATVCLGYLKDPRAIAPLFEILGKDIVFEEDAILDAFVELGDPARKFLIQTLKSRPLTKDNVHAAFALTAFASNPDIATVCFEELKDPEVYQKPLLRTYLISNCDALQHTNLRSSFADLALNPDLPLEMRSEIESIVHNWH